MYGLPAQTPEQAKADLAAAIALAPAHISHYQLTLEPGTVFYHRPPPLPDSEAIWQMQQECQQLLAAHGYQQYEVSAYARATRRSRHNLNYWRFGDYIGVGAGAHGKLTWLQYGESGKPAILRQRAGERISDRFAVAAAELPFEYMLNVLRLTDGFAETEFEARTGLAFTTIAAIAERAQLKGLLERAGAGHWRATELGQRFLNDLQALFLPEAATPAVAVGDRRRTKAMLPE
jgi:oxygen-independent coproporphyrinogen-3 oxidase